jgi:hypothetical protein
MAATQASQATPFFDPLAAFFQASDLTYKYHEIPVPQGFLWPFRRPN